MITAYNFWALAIVFSSLSAGTVIVCQCLARTGRDPFARRTDADAFEEAAEQAVALNRRIPQQRRGGTR